MIVAAVREQVRVTEEAVAARGALAFAEQRLEFKRSQRRIHSVLADIDRATEAFGFGIAELAMPFEVRS